MMMVMVDGFVQQVSKSESASGAVEQSYHHVLTLTHLVPWHYASMLLTGTCSSNYMYNVQCRVHHALC